MQTPWPYAIPQSLVGEAREKLSACLAHRGARAELARRLGCLPLPVSWWCSGQSVPQARYAEGIESILSIPASDWPRKRAVADAEDVGPLWTRRELPAAGTREEATEAMRAALAARGAKAAMARRLRCNPMEVYAICSGRRVPSAAQAIALEREIGVPLSWWGGDGAWMSDLGALRPMGAVEARAMLAGWARRWDDAGVPTKSWMRLRMTQERLVDVLAGAAPTAEEAETMAKTQAMPGIPERWWAE